MKIAEFCVPVLILALAANGLCAEKDSDHKNKGKTLNENVAVTLVFEIGGKVREHTIISNGAKITLQTQYQDEGTQIQTELSGQLLDQNGRILIKGYGVILNFLVGADGQKNITASGSLVAGWGEKTLVYVSDEAKIWIKVDRPGDIKTGTDAKSSTEDAQVLKKDLKTDTK
jgi:hypothetical protein